MRTRRTLAVVAATATVAAGLTAPSPAAAASSDVVISQIYGGGGNSGATLTNDFIELQNRGTAPVTVAASCSFATPLGYQTNMIVAKLGDYRFVDFMRVGVGMNLAALLTTLLVAGLLW